MDRVPPSEGGGCPFEPGREHFRDEAFIRRAMRLAGDAACMGDVPVGAILVARDRMFEGYNEKEFRFDPTAHAEMLVIREAARALETWRIGGTLYVTKEPCAMCAGAIVAARITRLVYGCDDVKAGAAGSVIDVLASAAANHRVLVTSGVLGSETGDQLQKYFRAKRSRNANSSARRRGIDNDADTGVARHANQASGNESEGGVDKRKMTSSPLAPAAIEWD